MAYRRGSYSLISARPITTGPRRHLRATEERREFRRETLHHSLGVLRARDIIVITGSKQPEVWTREWYRESGKWSEWRGGRTRSDVWAFIRKLQDNPNWKQEPGYD